MTNQPIVSGAESRGRKQDPEQDTNLLGQRAQTPPDQHPVSDNESDHEDQGPRQPADLLDLTDNSDSIDQNDPLDLGDPDENEEEYHGQGLEGGVDPDQPAHNFVALGPNADARNDPFDLGDPDENEEEYRGQDPQDVVDPAQPTHDSVVLGPNADPVDQPLTAATPTSPQPDQAPGPSQRRGRTRGRRLFSGLVMSLLGLISLAATAEAYTPVTPNGTMTHPGGPESVMTGLSGLTYPGTGWEEMTRISCGLLLLLIPVVAKLITRVQQLEDAMDQKPTPAEPVQAATSASEQGPAPETSLAELTAQIRQLEEALARQPVMDDRYPWTSRGRAGLRTIRRYHAPSGRSGASGAADAGLVSVWCYQEKDILTLALSGRYASIA